jgi:hypothetical protein
VHRIGVPIRFRTELKGAVAEEVVASAEYLLGTCDRLRTREGEDPPDERGQLLELSPVDRERRWPAGEVLTECDVRRAKVFTPERLADRGPGWGGDVGIQRRQERPSTPPWRDSRGTHASFELSCFTEYPEAQFLRLHCYQPIEDLSRHTARALGSDTGLRGVARLS